MNIKTPIHDFLTNYSRKNLTRCHTPGLKGRGVLNPAHDITEINGADSLYAGISENTGIIAESERFAAALFGAKKTLYSCSGGTLAIQAMLTILKTASRKNKVIAFRYAHRSFVSTAALLGFEVDWIYPGEFLSAALIPEEIKQAVTPDTAAVFVNGLDYYGGTCDIESIAKVCKQSEIPLLTDNAHGAYSVLTGNHPISLGAAMSADSAHKTLPALTGAAYLHIGTQKFAQNTKAATALFGTSSPSYLILESLDLCNKHIAGEKSKSKTEAFGLVANLKQNLLSTGFELHQSDSLRITVNARACGFTGIELAAALRENRVECEYADKNYTVLLFSTITDGRETEAVRTAFNKIHKKAPLKPLTFLVVKPKQEMNMRDALFTPDSDCAFLQPRQAKGKICAEITAPCPPGIPVIMPGELIGEAETEILENFGVEKIRVLN
ncbi:MAG: aminotransferase class V-fold PLP-dependent enzyme [Oscillospiraceae bacterium]|nr:aminotransferase class V-fold PLP-dependent enzyme [Oscillospiraceae bacterium]